MSGTPQRILRLVRPVAWADLCRENRSCGRIEPFHVDHAGAVLQLAAALVGPDGGPGPRPGRGLLDGLTSRPGREVTAWLAWDGEGAGRPIGLVALIAAGPAGRVRHSIGWLLVDPDHRRRGVGAALVQAAIDEAARVHATEVWVETHAAWPAATAFWQRLGFTPP